MKGLKVIVRRENEARKKKVRELEEIVSLRFHSSYELEQIRAELSRDYPEYIEEECTILFNDASHVVVEYPSDHTLHVLDIEGLKVVHTEFQEI